MAADGGNAEIDSVIGLLGIGGAVVGDTINGGDGGDGGDPTFLLRCIS